MFLKKVKSINISKMNVWLILSPFLLLYSFISIAFALPELNGDENRYIMYAGNLLNGFYSPPAPGIYLWNGPGYPLFIAPFLFLKLPIITLRLLNGLLLYFSLILSFKTLNLYTSRKNSIIFTIVLGLYFPNYTMLPLIMTEIFTWFLVSAVCYLFIKTLKEKSTSIKYLLGTSFVIAMLVMTKVIFGHVLLTILIVLFLMFLIPKFRSFTKKPTIIFLLSLLFCLPYLAYTYNLTGKPYYWANCGSLSLYTMSTPFENENGTWESRPHLFNNPNHSVFIDSVMRLEPLQEEEAFKIRAIENIKNHPKKYFSNWVANVGRLIFNYPGINTKQEINVYFTIIPNMFVIVFIVLSMAIGIMHYKVFPKELIILLLFILIYLSGSSLVSAYRRMFFITMPFWFIFISYVLSNYVSIKYKPEVSH